MADEITLNLRMAVQNNLYRETFDPRTVSVTMSGTTVTGGVQSIGTSAEAIVMNDVSSAGYAAFRNTGSSDIDLGTGTGTSFVGFGRVKAGEVAVMRLSTNAPAARASGSASNLQYLILSA
jgi:hypothetical protein